MPRATIHTRQLDVTSNTTAIPPTLISCLAPLGSKVLQRQSTSFQANRYAFDLRYTYDPAVIVMASSASDVQTAVRCAKNSNIPVAPRSGGHSYEGYSIGGQNGSLVIDLSALSSVTVQGNQAIVGGGIRLGPLYLSLYNQGNWTINAGTCPTVGIGGHALGGGFGLIARQYGLLVDRIQSMEVVDANGDLITASASQNTDLFFALRGAGGGSYGVVTSFTFLAIQAPPVVTSFTYDWSFSDYAGVLSAYANFQASAPRGLGLEMNVASTGLELYGAFQGTKDQQAAAIAPFLSATPTPTASDIQEGRLIDAQLRFAYLTGNPTDINALNLTGANQAGDSRYTKGKSLVYNQPLTNATIALIGKWVGQKPSGSTANYIIIDIWGGAIQDTPQNATAFVHRDAQTVFEFVAEWDESANAVPGKPDCQACLQWIDDMYADFLTDYNSNNGYYGPVRGYQNYIDSGMPNWQDAYYGSALNRLIQIKATADPGNVFSFPQSIPLNSTGVSITEYFSALFAAFSS
ncbi:hypothetical protein BGZ46_005881 [Entomortierella lignicola]|nr:hypothetical protein BGZ46_005881 [Entomortierella lignicola]